MSDEWIEFDVARPEDHERVLMFRENGSMGVGSIIDRGDYIRLEFNGTGKAWEYWNIKVTHWMPLPEPPEVLV